MSLTPNAQTKDSQTSARLHAAQWQAMQEALTQLRSEAISAAAFSELAQAQQDLLATLPSRFTEVLMQLLTRLESSALFTEESCSFSRQDLLDQLQRWLDKAEQAMAASVRG